MTILWLGATILPPDTFRAGVSPWDMLRS